MGLLYGMTIGLLSAHAATGGARPANRERMRDVVGQTLRRESEKVKEMYRPPVPSQVSASGGRRASPLGTLELPERVGDFGDAFGKFGVDPGEQFFCLIE